MGEKTTKAKDSTLEIQWEEQIRELRKRSKDRIWFKLSNRRVENKEEPGATQGRSRELWGIHNRSTWKVEAGRAT